MIYRLRFHWHLWRRTGYALYAVRWAFTYPTDSAIGDGDPIEDAEAEISYMGD